MDGLGGGLSFGHLSNLRQIEARKRLFETKLKIMDNEVVKFTCFKNQIPSYFTKLNDLEEIEKASKEFKSVLISSALNIVQSANEEKDQG